MKKPKKALSLTLALALSLVLAPPANAVDVEDSTYIKFSNQPISRGQLAAYYYPGSSDYDTYFPVLIFPDDTTYTLPTDLGGNEASIWWSNYSNSFGGWAGDIYAEFDGEWGDGYGNKIDLIAPVDNEYHELLNWSVYNPNLDEMIEDFYFCSQTAYDNWVSAGVIASFTTDITEQPTTPTEPSTPTTPSTPVPEKVVLSPQKLTVDGKAIDCEKYNIDGSNYFKLRDLAQLLNGTGSQFAVGYDDATSTVTITTGEAYVSTGTELVTGVDNSTTAQPSNQTILINGVAHGDLTVYNIGGSNFFQLRELGNILGFEVDYDVITDTAIVNSVQK